MKKFLVFTACMASMGISLAMENHKGKELLEGLLQVDGATRAMEIAQTIENPTCLLKTISNKNASASPFAILYTKYLAEGNGEILIFLKEIYHEQFDNKQKEQSVRQISSYLIAQRTGESYIEDDGPMSFTRYFFITVPNLDETSESREFEFAEYELKAENIRPTLSRKPLINCYLY
jgi:hypothetical protein